MQFRRRFLKCSCWQQVLPVHVHHVAADSKFGQSTFTMLLLTASFASPHSPRCCWQQVLPVHIHHVAADCKFCQSTFTMLLLTAVYVRCVLWFKSFLPIQTIFSLLILHRVSFLLTSLVFPFQIDLCGAGATVSLLSGILTECLPECHFLVQMRPLAAKHLLYPTLRFRFTVLQTHFVLQSGSCVGNAIYGWIGAYPGNQVSSLEYITGVVIVYAVLMFGSLNSSEIALSCLLCVSTVQFCFHYCSVLLFLSSFSCL